MCNSPIPAGIVYSFSSLCSQVFQSTYGLPSILPSQLDRLNVLTLHRTTQFITQKTTVTHSLNHVFHSPSLIHILTPHPLTQALIIKLEGTQGQCFISFPKGKEENCNEFVTRTRITVTKGRGRSDLPQTQTEPILENDYFFWKLRLCVHLQSVVQTRLLTSRRKSQMSLTLGWMIFFPGEMKVRNC